MALINCPECGRQISDKAATCPGCGLPASYFVLDTAASGNLQLADALPIKENYISGGTEKNRHDALPVSSIRNALISFEQDYRVLFSPNDYIDSKKAAIFRHSYQSVLKAVPDSSDRQLVESFIVENDIDDYHLNHFQAKMSMLDDDIQQHNDRYVEWRLNEYKDYFDQILVKIDPKEPLIKAGFSGATP